MFNGLTGRNQRSTGVYDPALFAVIRNDVVKNDSLALTLRLLMSYIYIYIYIYGAPILDVSRSHTTTQHSR